MPWPVERLSNRQLIAIPLVFAAIMATAVVIRGVPLSIEFAGGTLIRVRELDNRPNADAIEEAVEDFLTVDVKVRVTEDPETRKFGVHIEILKPAVDNQEAARVENMLTEKLGLADTYEAPIELYGELTGIHKEQAKWGITYAIIAMAIIIFIVFRRSVVVGTILLCIGLNMLGIVGGMALFQIPLGWPTLAAILMLLGYSIDTNILLVTRVVKRLGGEVRERIVDAMRTGLMMTFTTLAALFALNVFTTHPTLDYLSGALILGLIADLFNTWFLNGGVLIWHMKRREGKGYYVPT